MTQWLTKTNKGRVVYDRKPHTFSAADVNRVHIGWLDQANIDEIWDIATAIVFSSLAATDRRADFILAHDRLFDHIQTTIRFFQGEFEPQYVQNLRRLKAIVEEIMSWITFITKAYNLVL